MRRGAIRIFELEFPPESRNEHSHAFLRGVLDSLLRLLDGVCGLVPQPYQCGSAEADAYLFGTERGTQMVRRLTGPGARHAPR